jgi:diguanylate cyclase (GGDEF)-like protein/PAS domain S-box-containing protein
VQIRKKLPLVVLLLVAIPLILSNFVFYYFSSKKVRLINIEHLKSVAKLGSKSISATIDSHKREVELMTQLQEINNIVIERDNESLYKNVHQLIKDRVDKTSEINNIFIFDQQGNIILSAVDKLLNTSISDNQYFHEVMQDRVVMSNIITSKIDGTRGIYVAAPIRNDSGQVIGGLAYTIVMDFFSEYIKDIEFIEDGYSYLVDSKGKIISHPNPERIGQLTENTQLFNILELSRSGKVHPDGEGVYKYNGEKKYMGYSIIPGVNWVLVANQTFKSVENEIIKTLYMAAIVTLIVLAAAAFYGIKFSKSIIIPINKLTEIMGKAALGDLSVKCDYNAKDEFGQLSQDFNIMLDKLNISYEELTAVYEELAATEEELRIQYVELQENGEALRSSEEKYRLALEGANDVIWEWNLVSNDFYASDKWKDMTGYDPINKFDWNAMLDNVIHPEDRQRAEFDFRKHKHGKTDIYKSEFRIKCKEGNYKWVFNRGKILLDYDGNPLRIAGSLTDISDRKLAEEQIIYMAYYDSLTKLPNRVLFMDKFKSELLKLKQIDRRGALFFIDLDNFKNINDTLGHEYGDKLLQIISKRFEDITGEKDVICRFGGDEFLVLQPGISRDEEAIELANNILKIFNDVIIINEKQIYITGSIGIALYPRDGAEAGALLKNADAAMYKAKELGKNKFMFFNKNINSSLQRKVQIENVLRNAIDNNELQVFYQPQYNVVTKEIAGFEALLRLSSKELGFLAPDEFIPVAEETGLIISIGEWCLRKVCETNKRWKDAGYKYDFIAVNISSIQLQQGDFFKNVKCILGEVGLDPKYLELEITETVLMKSLDNNVRLLNKLRNIGVKIALDDFGTGYSSLNYLRKIPINILKIDKSFIDGICKDKKQKNLVIGIMQIAHNLNLDIVAEGVEVEQQLSLLKNYNCDRVQGYLLSKPMPEEAAEALLQKNTGDGSQK